MVDVHSENKFIAEDIRTVHSEIKQIINQRYSILTISITLLGLFITCITQIDKLGISNLFLEPAYFFGVFFLILLLLLNLYARILTKQLMTLSCFLTVQNFSTYEKFWGLYPRTKLTGYSYSQKLYFYILSILIISVCFLFTLSSESQFTFTNLFTAIISYVAYISILEITNKIILNKRIINQIRKNWEDVLNIEE